MQITKKTGNEWVIGVTVPNGILRVRRNGKECWTGNSGRELGNYSADEQPAKGSGEGGQCFIGRQSLKTLYGERDIGHIVEKKQGHLVWSYNFETGLWEYSPIIDWFTRQAAIEDILCIELGGAATYSDTRRYKWTSCIYPTKNHEIYTLNRGKVPACQLTKADMLCTYGPIPSEDQLSLLLGSLLGDASICPDKWQCEHSAHQADYVKWKSFVLSGLLPEFGTGMKKPNKLVPKWRKAIWLQMTAQHVLTELNDICKFGGKYKKVSKAWLDRVTDIGVAVWLLDDGSICNHTGAAARGSLNYTGAVSTMCFDAEELILLKDFLQDKLKAPVTITAAKCLCLSAAACASAVNLIASIIPWALIPKSKELLRTQACELQKFKPPRAINNVCALGTVPAVIKDIRPYIHDRPGITHIPVYDITVKNNHTYVVGGVLVSNSKRLGGLDTNALLSHNATENLKDVMVTKGTKNEDYWNALKMGRPLPAPGVPFVYNKFIALLKAGGANVTRKGDMQLLSSLTDKDIDKMAAGEIRNSDTVDAATLKPKTGGLFDEAITGGTTGSRWAKITLQEPVPNPAMEDPIRRLLGLTGKEFRDVLAGRTKLGEQTGGLAITAALADIGSDLDGKIKYYRNEVMNSRGARRDDAVKCMRYLVNAQKQGIPLTDWMLTKIPVLPPVFRPVSKMGDMLMAADINELYRDVIELNNHLRDGRGVLPDSELADAKENLYDGVQAVMGWGEPTTDEGMSKKLKGAIRTVIGSSPKFGLLQHKVISKTMDLVARGTVAPDPDLDMDSIGIPEDKAWQLYKPFVSRVLVQRGFPPVKVREMLEEKTKEARSVLEQVMRERPVIVNRAPSWHKFNVMAFEPFITDENVIRVSPLVTSGFNMDFDGDAANFHVPVGDKAVKEAWEKMTPSKNLFKTMDLRTPQHMPSKEMLLGLYQMTREPDKKAKPVVFNTEQEAKDAYTHGLIKYNDPIIIKEKS